MWSIGRRPNTAGLGLARVGIETTDRGAIPVDEHWRTSQPSIYACGDVIDRFALTPVALAEGMQIARNLFEQSLQLDPTFDRARYRLALLFLDDDPARSLSMLEAILARDPLHHGSAYNRALALRNLDRNEQAKQAMAHYRKILDGRSRISLLRERWAVAPLDLELMLELGRVHRDLGAIAEALRWYSRAGLSTQTDPRPAVESVRTLLAAGKRTEATELVRRLRGTAAAEPIVAGYAETSGFSGHLA